MFAEARFASAAVAQQRSDNRERFATIGARLRELSPRAVLTCARGSSDHAATFAKYLVETRLRVPTASAAPSMSSVYGASLQAERTLFLAISQSGQSPDLLASARAARDGGALTLALVNDAASPLAELSDLVLPLTAGPERSVAATKSYIASLTALVGLVAAWSGDSALDAAADRLPDALQRAWGLDWSALTDALLGATSLFVLGRGLGLGIAQEAALKFKETCGLHAEAFSAAEVRHGPMALVGPDFPVLIFRQGDETGDSVEALAGELAERGANVLLAGGAAPGATTLPSLSEDPVLEPILQVQSFYRAVNALSVARGFDPDCPPHLKKVTETL